MTSLPGFSEGQNYRRIIQYCKLVMVYPVPVAGSPGVSSSIDDIDRLLTRDYEPSDQDVVKARLRTVGVQEYHFRIPRGMHTAPDATPASSQDLGYDDWILYDVGGLRRSVSHIPSLDLAFSDVGNMVR